MSTSASGRSRNTSCLLRIGAETLNILTVLVADDTAGLFIDIFTLQICFLILAHLFLD